MIGALRHRVTLQSGARVPDAGGGAEIVWTDIATLWASLKGIAGNERDAADRLDARAKYRLRLRHREDVKPGMRFVAGSRIYTIKAALDEDGDRRWLSCVCEEGAGS